MKTMVQLLITRTILVLILTLHLSLLQSQNKVHLDSLLNEINSHFTMNGKPINPKVIHDFAGGIFEMSDGPIITSLDLELANYSNRYFCDSCLGKYKVDYGINKDGIWEGYFLYKYLGKTTNNIHVIETEANGGGSGSWSTILFLSVYTRTAYRNGEKTQQLIMNLEGSAPGAYGAGQYGTSTKVSINANKVLIDYETTQPSEKGASAKNRRHNEFSF